MASEFAKLSAKWPEAQSEIKLVRPLGKGGYGSVYLAEYLGQPYVLKVSLYPAEKPIPLGIAKEMKMSGKIDHPKCDKVLKIMQPAPGVVLFFRSADSVGISMRQWHDALSPAGGPAGIARNPGRTPAEILTVAKDVTEALVYLHSQGIAHVDIKPENIVIKGSLANGDLQAMLIDFGLSCLPGSSEVHEKCHLRAGSPRYMDPRDPRPGRGGRARVKTAEEYYASDIYALAVTLYFLYEKGTLFPPGYEGDVEGITDAKLAFARRPVWGVTPQWVIDILTFKRSPTAAQLLKTIEIVGGELGRVRFNESDSDDWDESSSDSSPDSPGSSSSDGDSFESSE